ncbi:hypothetical protein ACLOJK_016995 [Asimina triloba]
MQHEDKMLLPANERYIRYVLREGSSAKRSLRNPLSWEQPEYRFESGAMAGAAGGHSPFLCKVQNHGSGEDWIVKIATALDLSESLQPRRRGEHKQSSKFIAVVLIYFFNAFMI